MLLLIAGLFVLFLIVGMPVAFALALASIPEFIATGTMPPTIAIQKMVTATQSFPLLAVPFFIFAGNLMNATGITDRLVNFARLLTGWMAGGLMVTAFFVARRNGYAADLPQMPAFRHLASSFAESVWALAFPVILIIGFRFGFFTATEADTFLVFYALFIGIFIYRELNWERFYAAVQSSISDLGMIMLLIMIAAVLGYAVTIERGPQQITEFVTSLTSQPGMILLLVALLLIGRGMFLEGAANILLVTPIVLPALAQAGFDPAHMGILIVCLINFGGLTPPVGVIMFTDCGILDVKTSAFTKASLPYFAAVLLFFLIIALVPDLSLFLPNAVM